MKGVPHNHDYTSWIVKKEHVLPATAARREQFLHRLISLGADINTTDVETELIKTVPCYENLRRQIRWEYRCALKRWQEYTAEA